jgi:hypothetical protein
MLKRLDMPYQAAGLGLRASSGVLLFLLGAAILVAASALPAISWRMAVGFVGPEAYVWMKSSLWPSLSDFPTSALAYDSSLVMQSYVWAAAWFDITPTHLAGVHVVLQALLFTYAAWQLGFALSGNQGTALVVCAVILVSQLTGANLGRFGDGLQGSVHALYYGYANAFSMMALAYRFEMRHGLAAMVLLACGLSHPTIGLYTGLFIAFSLWVRPPRLPDLRTLWPYGLTAFTMAIWIIASSPSSTEPALSAEAFIRATRTFSAHWHPLHLEIFTRGFYGNAAPLIFSLAVLIIVYPALSRIVDQQLSRALVTGTIGMFLISAVGIVFTDVWPIKVIVELCPQRGSFTVTLLAGTLGAVYLWQKLHSGDLIEALVATLALAALATPSGGMAVLPWALLALLQWRQDGDWRDGRRIINLCAALLLLTPIVIVEPSRALTGSAKMLQYLPGLAIFTFIFVLSWQSKARAPAGAERPLIASWTIAICLLLTVAIGRYETYAADQRAFGRMGPSALAAQSWARQHTAPDALFMTDPSFIYGWRDYAKRATFGTYREWGMFGFIYGGIASTYEEGLRRFALFDVDPVAVADDHERRGLPLREAGRHIQSLINLSFNNKPLLELFNIAKRERVDYLVIYSDRFVGDRENAKPVYQNTGIEIYAVPPNG